jgi:hypothetical protein
VLRLRFVKEAEANIRAAALAKTATAAA